MMPFKISTKDPKSLVEEIIQKIDDGSIRSWIYQDGRFSHKGSQYADQMLIEFKIDDTKGIIEIELDVVEGSFAESRAYQLLEGMLSRHFKHKVEFIAINN